MAAGKSCSAIAKGPLAASRFGRQSRQAVDRRKHQSRRNRRSLRDAMRGADVFIAFPPRSRDGRRREAHGRRPRGVRPGQSRPGNRSRGGDVVCASRCHGPVRLIRTRSQRTLLPGLFRGMFDVRALRVTEAMKIAAARAIAEIIPRITFGPTTSFQRVRQAGRGGRGQGRSEGRHRMWRRR